MIPESIMDSSYRVFAESNMGRMAKLATKWSFRAVLLTDEQALLASNRLSCEAFLRESNLPVMFDLEREKVSLEILLLDSSCGHPEVNLKLPVTLH